MTQTLLMPWGRVTGVSVGDNESVFVRGLGERYSNTTLAGITLPTTEPDRRIIPLDLFPTGLIDSVQVSKTYLPPTGHHSLQAA